VTTLEVDVRLDRGSFHLDARFVAGGDGPVALLGPNGAGKSTVVSVVAGLVRPDQGTVRVDTELLDAPGVHIPPERRAIGVVFQDLRLFPFMSARDNVAYPLRVRGASKSDAHARAQELLESFDVAHRSNAVPAELSGGEAQRVALARALAHRPRLLVLDEPLSALDVEARPAARSVLRRALTAFDGASILVTHDPVEAMSLAGSVVVLEAGRVTQTGTPEEIRAAPRTPFAAALVGLNFFRGRLEPLEEGAGMIRTERGDVIVRWPAGMSAALDDVRAFLRPGDVALYRAQPEGSARNVVRGTISSIALEGDRARIRIDGAPPLVADVTPGSVVRLGLAEGVEVWASFKAMEVTLALP
jgi:molybdate transport system ATP-binding protein